jgi:thioredoxin reductase
MVMNTKKFDVIIVGGSYSGLAAGMALGRALRQVLIIDSGQPCNRQTPRSHNFITQDGKTPQEISTAARRQVEAYNTVTFYNGLATGGRRTEEGFEISTRAGDVFIAKKLVFATGIRDVMPDIKGFAECWGITVIHCPYCHGYEVRNEKTGIFANGDIAFDFSKLIHNWTKDLSLLTNGQCTLSGEQSQLLKGRGINIIPAEIDRLEQQKGHLQAVIFKDGSHLPLKALYAKIPFVQHCDLPKNLGCELTEHGFIQVDAFQKTSVPGIYACGDNTTFMRSIANSVAMGTLSGVMANKEIIDEEF